MYEMYEIWLKTEYHTTGCPEDESETTKQQNYFYIIKLSELDAFHEATADDYGSQDYGYEVKYTKLMAIDSEDLKQLIKTLKTKVQE